MPTFSYKAAKQLCFLCASFACLSLTPSKQPSQDAQFLKRMKAYWKEGDFETAKRQIRSYLQTNNHSELSEELHLLLGDLYFKDGNFEASLEEYEKVAKKELKDKVFYNKVLCLYELEKTQELADISSSYSKIEGLTPEQKNSVGYLCASSLFNYLLTTSDKDPAILDRTKDLFEACKGTSFESLSFYPLAKLHELTQNKTKAAVYYEAAAKANPEKESEFLFQAAFLQSETAPNFAIDNFLKVISLNSGKQSSALYNCLLLQYQTNQFHTLIATYEKHQNVLEESQKALATYIFGKSLYQVGNFEKAAESLLSTLNSSLPASSQKTAQLMVLKCAHKMQNPELYYKVFRNPHYPLVNDPSYSTAHLVYLDLLKSSGKYPEFIEESKMFVAQNPDNKERENVLWDAGSFLYETKNWKEADHLFVKLLLEHPSTKYEAGAIRYRLNCSIAELHKSSDATAHDLRGKFIEKIEIALHKEGVLNEEEKELFSFELIKNLFLEEKFSSALTAISDFTATYSTSRFAKDLELLQTLCYLKDPNAPDLFIASATTFLKNQPSDPQADKIRLHLFNTYVELSEKASEEEKSTILDKAAEQLYSVFEKRSNPLQAENLDWLSQHYYLQAKQREKDLVITDLSLERASEVLEYILSSQSVPLNKETEIQLFKLSEILTLAQKTEKKAYILQRFLNTPDAPLTSIQRQLSFELAKTYQQLGDLPKALDLYTSLIQNFPESQIRALAVLERSKLLVSYLSEDQQTEDNQLYAQNLNDLKDLEVQKSLLSEPLHLEAGLEYIRWKSPVSKEGSQEKTLSLLRLFKEGFEGELFEEIEPSQSEEKKQVLAHYLKYVEAEILRYEAYLMENQTDAKVLAQESKEKMEELLSLASLPETLKKRIEQSKQELK